MSSRRGYAYGGYQNRFVSASSNSAATSLAAGGSSSGQNKEYKYGEGAALHGAMHSVPPPAQLTTTSSAPILPPATGPVRLTAKQIEDQKMQQYNNLVYGSTSGKKERKKRIYEDAYLEGEDSDEEGRETDERVQAEKRLEEDEKMKTEQDEEEEDELDAFMADINKQAESDKKQSEEKEKLRVAGKEKEQTDEEKKKALGRADIDEEDMQESFMRYMEEHKAKIEEQEEDFEYDEDGNIIWSWKKVIDPLSSIDHSEIDYPSFNKNFYKPHPDIEKMSYMDIVKLRNSLNVRVGGLLPPNPVCSFGHFGFDEYLMEAIRRSEYEKPTPIQAQAVPAALSGRDVLGIAKTGSGKTAAYLWPAIVHIMDQPDLKEGEGPIALIIVPTRELAIQVYQEAKRFCRVYNINVICAYGGGSKWEQSNELQGEGAELVVCTPGRIIDLVKIEATNFLRTTFLVFDEADRMFDMGFEAQVKSISDHVRPDRQCLMFSATFKQKVERLARDALRDPVRIVQGEVGEANADVKQTVVLLPSQDAKLAWLSQRLVDFASLGKVLIFVTKKLDSEELAHKLSARDFKLVLLHGDMLQAERNEMLLSFRKKMSIMIATDVAARGLDIPEIRTVINYDLARDIDTHVHRIGRTGRAGQTGNAYTLVTEKDVEMAGHLVKNLESVNQEVSKELLNLALKAPWFSSERRNSLQATGSNATRQRFGLGFKPKVKGPTAGGQFDPLKEQKSSSSSKAPSLEKTMAAAASGGPMNRTEVMKKAFKSSFAHSFKASTMESSNLPQQAVSDPRPEWKRKIDEINAKLTAGHSRGGETSSSGGNEERSLGDGQKKKRSRWE